MTLDSLDTLAYLEVVGFLVPQEIEVHKGLWDFRDTLVLREYQDNLDREERWVHLEPLGKLDRLDHLVLEDHRVYLDLLEILG